MSEAAEIIESSQSSFFQNNKHLGKQSIVQSENFNRSVLFQDHDNQVEYNNPSEQDHHLHLDSNSLKINILLPHHFDQEVQCTLMDKRGADFIQSSVQQLNSFHDLFVPVQVQSLRAQNVVLCPLKQKKQHTRSSIHRKFKSAMNSHTESVNRDLCSLLDPMIRQINKLEQNVSRKIQFLKNMQRLKLAIYMFEHLFLRFQDMYNYQSRELIFLKTEEKLLHVQWKLLYLERLHYNVTQKQQYQENTSSTTSSNQMKFSVHSKLNINNRIKFSKPAINHIQPFKLLITASINYFTMDQLQRRVTLTLKEAIAGENQKRYMRLKIALSRVLPTPWETILLDNNGSQIILTFLDGSQLLEVVKNSLIRIVPEKKTIVQRLLKIPISFIRSTLCPKQLKQNDVLNDDYTADFNNEDTTIEEMIESIRQFNSSLNTTILKANKTMVVVSSNENKEHLLSQINKIH